MKVTDDDMLAIIAKLSMDDQLALIAKLLPENNVTTTRWYQRWLEEHARYAHVVLGRAGLE